MRNRGALAAGRAAAAAQSGPASGGQGSCERHQRLHRRACPGATGDTSSVQTQGYHQRFTDLTHTPLRRLADSQHAFPRAARTGFPFCAS
uniref:Uncharacterized protein n=1 Tax=Rangifer tarandus platyrhynchus TaxID=3082113 RepID=A0ACB0F6I3_RANTA|nr:unnamed protein product [Rangifer tarandus platyrhynchus]